MVGRLVSDCRYKTTDLTIQRLKYRTRAGSLFDDNYFDNKPLEEGQAAASLL